MADAFHFTALTPNLQLDALQSIGIYADSGLLALNSYENRVYQFRADDGKRYVVKFYRPQRWTDAQILEEHQFAAELVDADVPIAAPIARDGVTLHHFAQQRFAVYPSVGGRAFETDNLDHYEQLGFFLGKLHQVGNIRPFKARPQLDLSGDIRRAAALLQQSPLVAVDIKPRLDHLITQALGSLPRSTLPTRRCHGDCHAGNLLMHDSITLLDLDDSLQAPAMMDFYLLLNGPRDEQRLQLDVLLEGYENFCAFDPSELALLDALRLRRIVCYMAWLAQRWEDAAFPLAFPWFSQPSYWQQQLNALEHQVAALQTPLLTIGPCY